MGRVNKVSYFIVVLLVFNVLILVLDFGFDIEEGATSILLSALAAPRLLRKICVLEQFPPDAKTRAMCVIHKSVYITSTYRHVIFLVFLVLVLVLLFIFLFVVIIVLPDLGRRIVGILIVLGRIIVVAIGIVSAVGRARIIIFPAYAASAMAVIAGGDGGFRLIFISTVAVIFLAFIIRGDFGRGVEVIVFRLRVVML
jgi:hypothetical protein